MPWIRLDDQFVDNPKLADIGVLAPLCGWQFVAILSWCNRYLTDGRIPKRKAWDVVGWEHIGYDTAGTDLMSVGEDVEGKVLCEWLVETGHLEEVDEWNYQVHDYLEYQPSRAHVLKERAASAARSQSHRERKAVEDNSPSNASRHAPGDAPGDAHVTDTPNPIPSKEKQRPKTREVTPKTEQEEVVSTPTSGGWRDVVEPWTKPYPPVMAVDELIGLSPEQIKAYDQRDREWREQHGMKA